MLEQIVYYIPILLPFLLVTFHYVLLSLVFGTLLAFVVLLAKQSRFVLLRALGFGYTTIMRCTPSIILLFLVFYGLPPLLYSLTGIDINDVEPLVFVVATFTLFLGASLSEVMRSAYDNVDRGQYEAAVCAGLSRSQAFIRIVIPQVFYLMIPNLGNSIQFLIKEGALGYTIGLIDIMGKAFILNANTLSAYILPIYLALSLIYWPLSIVIERLFDSLEKKFSAGYLEPQARKAPSKRKAA